MDLQSSSSAGCRGDLESLCRRVGARFGSEFEAAGAGFPTGLKAIDDLPSGGLPKPGLTELIEGLPSCGLDLVLHRLLRRAYEAHCFAALVDGGDGFDPASADAEVLEQLYWVRGGDGGRLETVLRAADILSACGSFGFLFLDLRGFPERELRRVPSRRWYRLQRSIRQAGGCCIVLSPDALVPSAALRLRFVRALPLHCLHPGPHQAREAAVAEAAESAEAASLLSPEPLGLGKVVRAG